MAYSTSAAPPQGAGASVGATVEESEISLSDNTTNDVSTTKHGFAPKAPNDTTKFLRGDASWAVPSSDIVRVTAFTATTTSTIEADFTTTGSVTGITISDALYLKFASSSDPVSGIDLIHKIKISDGTNTITTADISGTGGEFFGDVLIVPDPTTPTKAHLLARCINGNDGAVNDAISLSTFDITQTLTITVRGNADSGKTQKCRVIAFRLKGA